MGWIECICPECYCEDGRDCEITIEPCCVATHGDSTGLHLPKFKKYHLPIPEGRGVIDNK